MSKMAEFVTMLLVVATLASSSSSVHPAPDDDLATAVDEMRSAGYFSFVMLLSISPPNLIRGNVTFLLPDDKTLSSNRLPVHGISDFLLRHTIPSPLLFDYLQHIPTGSVLPTLEPEYMVGIDNQGRKSFFLNNVRVSNPNVCVEGSSIRCHGIDSVLLASPSTHCSNVSTGTVEPEAPRLPLPPSLTDSDLASLPPASPSNPNHQQSSGSRPRSSSSGALRYMWALTLAVGSSWIRGFHPHLDWVRP